MDTKAEPLDHADFPSLLFVEKSIPRARVTKSINVGWHPRSPQEIWRIDRRQHACFDWIIYRENSCISSALILPIHPVKHFDCWTLWSRCGRIIAHTLQTPRSLWSEQDSREWRQAASDNIRSVLEKAGIGGERIAAIGLTGQMHGLVLLDEVRNVLRPAILWNDQRTQSQCDDIHRRTSQGVSALKSNCRKMYLIGVTKYQKWVSGFFTWPYWYSRQSAKSWLWKTKMKAGFMDER